jgi:hypothetical protein
MTNKEFDDILVEQIELCRGIAASKGVDYSGDNDRLKNFKDVAAQLGGTPQYALGVYLMKHVDSIKTWIKRGELKGEPIEAKIDDAIMYLLLLKGMVYEQRAAPAGDI